MPLPLYFEVGMVRFTKSVGLLLSAIFFIAITVLFCQRMSNEVGIVRYNERENAQEYRSFSINGKSISPEANEVCKVLEPSEHDVYLIKRGYDTQISDAENKQTVRCTIFWNCSGTRISHVSCSPVLCSFTVNSLATGDTETKVSSRGLEEILTIRGQTGQIEKDISDDLLLQCVNQTDNESPSSQSLDLEIDHAYTGNCRKRILGMNETSISSKHFDIHVFYFRFLSRFQFLNRMKLLASDVSTSVSSDILYIDFTKYQSQTWKDFENINRLFYGKDTKSTGKPTLLQAAKRAGVKTHIFDTWIMDTGHRDLFPEEIIKSFESYCKSLTQAGFKPEVNEEQASRDCCWTEDDKPVSFDSNLRRLYKCFFLLSKYKKNSGNRLLTFSFLDSADMETDDILDRTVSNLVRRVLRRQDSIVLLTSDIGDPALSHLGSSSFLETESSNPLFFMAIPNRLKNVIGRTNLATLRKNSNSLISIDDIHETIKHLLEFGGSTRYVHSFKLNSRIPPGVSLFKPTEVRRTCDTLQINPPGFCICQEQYVMYPNDTIQVAFAEYAIGVINNYIEDHYTRKVVKQNFTMKSSFETCHKLRGLYFSNVRIAIFPDARKTVLDLVAIGKTSRDILYIPNVEIELHSTRGNQSVSINLRGQRLNSPGQKHEEFCMGGDTFRQSYVHLSKKELQATISRSFGVSPRTFRIHKECLFLFVRSFNDSASFEVGNICDDRKYQFYFYSSLFHIFSIVPLPVKVTVEPGSRRFLTSFVKSSYMVNRALFHYETDFEVFSL